MKYYEERKKLQKTNEQKKKQQEKLKLFRPEGAGITNIIKYRL